ncbi:integrase family protein [Methylobacterium sp. 4-46]|uniref:tyrosine-type recombinase/integrase n=1 Tax=unclassified Methylobacterium TaxID=2615210 RepID=UPI000152DB4F|nr:MULTISPECIES: site-specific integrase [Methylobacterium]ACA18423.1 integrase family protein [Methylobacterium sp. 4-46]WFT77716.1 site-specific integrase [Methylobacterium nodulans]
MADIYLRGQTWWGRVQKDGKDLRASLGTRSEGVARQRLAIWLGELEAQAWGAKPRLTLNTVMAEFIREHGPTLRPSTLRRYGVSIAWLDEHFRGKLLLEIKPADLRAFETARRTAGASAPTVRRDLACLSTIFAFAIEKEYADLNPVTPFIRQRARRGLRESPPRTRYLSRAEEARLLDGALPYVRDAILFAIYTGLRMEEQFSLTWAQVDLARKHLTISAEAAKGKRERTVIMLAPAVGVLERMPRHLTSPYVFHHGAATTTRGATRRAALPRPDRNDGERFNNLDRGLRNAAARAKVQDLRWHDLRRTHGCRLLQEERWSMEMVRDQLGHRSVVQTEKAYAFLEVEARRAAAHGAGAAPMVDLDPVTGKPLVAQKPAQGRRFDLEKQAKSKR